MTLSELAKRASDMLKERPELANLPVYASHAKSSRTKQYLPIQFGCGSTLTVGETKIVGFTTQLTGVIQFDHRGATTPYHN